MLLCDPERIRARAADLVATSEEFLQASWAAASTGGEAPIDLASAAFHDLDDVLATPRARPRLVEPVAVRP